MTSRGSCHTGLYVSDFYIFVIFIHIQLKSFIRVCVKGCSDRSMELGRPLFLFLLTFTLVRSQALVGEESCLQIFSVPRKSVVCEPSAEVKASLQEVKDSTVKLGEDIGVLSGRLDEIDPNVEKELPEEVKQRLAEIEELKLSHAAQVSWV